MYCYSSQTGFEEFHSMWIFMLCREIHCLLQNLLRACPFLQYLHLIQGFSDSFSNFTIYETVKSSCCKLTFYDNYDK